MSYKKTYLFRASLLAGLILTPLLIQLVHPLVHHHHHHERHGHGYTLTHAHDEFCPIGSFEYYKFQHEEAPSLSQIEEYPAEITPRTIEGYRDKAPASSIATRAPPWPAA